jgi:hypothetical protein
LLETKEKVTVIFPDESLKNRDEKQNQAMLALFKDEQAKFKDRFTF